MEKKHVCAVCKKRFASQAALTQHRRDAHGGVGSSKSKDLGGGPAKRRLPSQAGSPNVVAQPQRVIGRVPRDVAEIGGLDRLYHTDSVLTFPSGAVVYSVTIVPGVFKRLAVVSEAFQHIVYERLVFRIEPQMSAFTSGGYVAGFVSDPDDSVNRLDQLTAVANSVTTKWWQGATVVAPITRRNYFTAHGVELREFSPGSFYVMVDGKATQAGSLTIFCEWQAKLSGAIMEAPPLKTLMTTKDIYIRNGHQGLWVPTGKASPADWSDRMEDILPGSKAGDAFRLPYPVSLVKPNDNTLALHHWLYIQDKESVFLSVNSPSDYYAAAYLIDNLVVTRGTPLEKWKPSDSVSGEELVRPSLDSLTMTAGSQTSENALGQLTEVLLRLLKISERSSTLSQGSRETSLSEESFLLMPSPPE